MGNFMKKFSFLHLRYFYDAVLLESVSKSAKKNFVTQSTVSQAIHKLEVGLNRELVQHQRKKLELTHFGKYFFKQQHALFQAWEVFENQIEDQKTNLTGELNIGTTAGLVTTYLQPYLQKFNQLYPNVEIKIQVLMPDQILKKIQKQTLETGIILENMALGYFKTKILHRGYFKSYRKEKSIIPIEAEKFILSGDFPETQKLKKKYQQKFNKELEIAFIIPSWLGIAHYVNQYEGIGFFPDYIQQYHGLKDKVEPCFPSLANIPYKIVSVATKNNNLSRLHQAFINLY